MTFNFIFSKISNKQNLVMYEVCVRSIQDKEYVTLKEILLKFTYFVELKTHLEESDFEVLLRRVQYQTIVRHQPLILDGETVYFFMQKGYIMRKQPSGKSQKSFRVKQKTRIYNGKNYNRLPEIKYPISYQIEEYDAFQDCANLFSKYIQHAYYPQTGKPTIALFININSLPEDLKQRIKTINLQKLKFLADCGELRTAQRQTILEYLHKFQFLRINFGQTLYSKRVRSEYSFFLRKGLIQVLHTDKKSNKSVINAKSSLSIEQTDTQAARCISQKIQCYSIKREILYTLILKHKQKNTFIENNGKYLESNCRTVAMTPSHADDIEESSFSKNDSLLSGALASVGSNSRAYQRRFVHKSSQQLKESQEKNRKRFKVRQHFSNFYNEVFKEFSQRKIKYMGLKIQDQQNLVLYNLKVMQKKAPDMNEIKHKLKKMRIEKMKLYQNQIHRQDHIHSPQHNNHIL